MYLERKMARWGIAVFMGILAIGLGAFPMHVSAQTSGGIGLVNTELVLRQTPGYQEADSTLAAERAVYQAEATALQARLDSGSDCGSSAHVFPPSLQGNDSPYGLHCQVDLFSLNRT